MTMALGTAVLPDSLQALVTGISIPAEGVLVLELRSACADPLPRWTPGAHIDVLLPSGDTRQYSLCGDPADQESWRIGVALDPAGRGGSRFIHDHVRAGATLTLSAPRNNFPLVDAESYLFIAGGIGITPLLPMIGAVEQAGRPWTLVYGGRTRRSMPFVDQLLALDGSKVRVQPRDEFGLLDLGSILSAEVPGLAVYCCGPEGLISEAENLCRDWRMGTLHRERFGPGSFLQKAEGAFTVELARSGTYVDVQPDQGVLDALEELGCSIPNSCRAGICGACLVTVLSGVPEHNDCILTDEQRAANTMMLPCVSRSKSDVLVLDL
jgi:ferredoxin-NADP reductase